MKHLEIENKYLLSYEKAVNFINSIKNYKVDKIEQAYFAYTPKYTKRVRKLNNKYILTVKKGNGIIREESEKRINKKIYKKLIKRKIGKIIKKNRYRFELDRYRFELDIFKSNLKKLAFLEIEFQDKKELKNFILPDTLKNIIIKDVSEDMHYTNAFLAVSYPMTKEIDKIYKKIKSDPFNYKFKFKKKINIYDYLRIRLYCYFIFVKYYTKKFLKDENDEDLHQFRVNIRKIRSLLWSFREIFDTDIYQKLSISLNSIAVKTNQKRDIDVFLEFLDTYKQDYKKFYNYLKYKQLVQKKEIEIFFTSKEFKKALFDIKFFLKCKKEFYTNTFGYMPALVIGDMKIKKLYKEIKCSIKKLSLSDSVKKYYKIRIKIKKLRYLLEIFPFSKHNKEIINKRYLYKKLQDSFGTLNDIYNQITILKEYIVIQGDSHKNLALLQTILENRFQKNKTVIIEKSSFNF